MKKILLFLLSFSLMVQSRAQTGAFGGGIDDQITSYGFAFNYYSTESIVYRKDGWQDPFFDALRNQFATGTLKGIESIPAGGIGFSAIINISVVPDLLDLRTTPRYIFTRYTLRYLYLDPSEKSRKKDLRFSGFEIPFSTRLRSSKFGNFRANFITGFKYSVNLRGDAKADDSDLIPIKRTLKYSTSFLSFDVGMGLEVYFEFFRMIAEIKLSYSLTNAIKHEESPFSNPIIQVIPKATTFSFYFQ